MTGRKGTLAYSSNGVWWDDQDMTTRVVILGGGADGTLAANRLRRAEFCFLADWYFRERGIRHRIEIIYVTPLDAAFTKPVAAHRLAGMLAEKQIALIIEFNTGEVDGPRGALIAFDGREVAFDLAVIVPVHSGADYVGRSPGLGDALNFVETDEHTLQSKVAVNVFVIGDAANVPASKAGSVTHFEGDTVSLPRLGRAAAPQGIEDEPAHQADVAVVLLARPPART